MFVCFHLPEPGGPAELGPADVAGLPGPGGDADCGTAPALLHLAHGAVARLLPARVLALDTAAFEIPYRILSLFITIPVSFNQTYYCS